MARKNRKSQKNDYSASDVKNNPFASFDLPFVEEPKPEPVKEEKKEEESGKPKLSKADQALLDAWGGGEELELDVRKMCRRKLKMRLEKKRRAGKLVTTVRGFTSDDEQYMMELISAVKRKLGVGGFFREGFLEIQGNQLERLGPIFDELGYDIVEG